MTSIAKGAALGAMSGLAGAGAMAASSKLEQLLTQRPNSYVPGHTLAHLLGLRNPDADRWGRNMAMHYASGAIAGVLREVMSAANPRGPFASLMHANLRLSFDQTLENATGVGRRHGRNPATSCSSTSWRRRCSASPPARSPTPSSRRPRRARPGARRSALGARLKGFA